jgi:hypothetical protein
MHTCELLLFGDDVFVTYVQRMSYYYDDTTYCSVFMLTLILSSVSDVELCGVYTPSTQEDKKMNSLQCTDDGLLRLKRVWVILNHWCLRLLVNLYDDYKLHSMTNIKESQ